MLKELLKNLQHFQIPGKWISIDKQFSFKGQHDWVLLLRMTCQCEKGGYQCDAIYNNGTLFILFLVWGQIKHWLIWPESFSYCLPCHLAHVPASQCMRTSIHRQSFHSRKQFVATYQANALCSGAVDAIGWDFLILLGKRKKKSKSIKYSTWSNKSCMAGQLTTLSLPFGHNAKSVFWMSVIDEDVEWFMKREWFGQVRRSKWWIVDFCGFMWLITVTWTWKRLTLLINWESTTPGN